MIEFAALRQWEVTLSLAAASEYTVHNERHGENKGGERQDEAVERGHFEKLDASTCQTASLDLPLSLSLYNPFSDPPMLSPIIWGRPQPVITGP